MGQMGAPGVPRNHHQAVPGEVVRSCGHREGVFIPTCTKREMAFYTAWSERMPCLRCRVENVKSHGYRVITAAG